MDNEEYYFSYGMLTDPLIMPEEAEFYGKAILQNHSLEFRYYANALESNDYMYGVLWGVDQSLLSELDMIEGVPTLYTRKKVQVTNKELGTVQAWVYNMTDNTRENLKEKEPAASYIKSVLYGYREAGIPTHEVRKGLDHGRD